MQTSVAKPSNAGFTLIELMVVILLVGLALGVGLTLDFSSSPQRLEQQTREVANISGLLAQEAVLSGAILGLDFFTDVSEGARTGMRWLQLEDETWGPVDIGESGEQHEMIFAADIDVELLVEANTVVIENRVDLETLVVDVRQTFSPELLFLPSREVTPFMLSLGGEDSNVSTVSADIMGRVRVDEDAPAPP